LRVEGWKGLDQGEGLIEATPSFLDPAILPWSRRLARYTAWIGPLTDGVPFSIRPSPNRACDFHRTRLSSGRILRKSGGCAPITGGYDYRRTTPPASRLPQSLPFRSTCPPSPCSRVDAWRGSWLIPEFVYLSVCVGSDGQPVARPFPCVPPRTVLASFPAHGSPVALSFDRGSRRSPGVNPLVAFATFSVDGEDRLGVLHYAYLHDPIIGPPDLLRPADGFPALRLLSGLRRHGARAL
jgi:hypothetical protein